MKWFGKKTPAPQQSATVRDELIKRFDGARLIGGKTLDLGGLGLEEVPAEVWSLPLLERIYLAGNRLQTKASRLWDLRHLRSVDVTGNPIVQLPDRPGLMIDESIYQRCRGQLDAGHIAGIEIRGKTPVDDENYWQLELFRMTELRELSIGSWEIFFRDLEPQRPPLPILNVLHHLAELNGLESLFLCGWQPPVPESIQNLRHL